MENAREMRHGDGAHILRHQFVVLEIRSQNDFAQSNGLRDLGQQNAQAAMFGGGQAIAVEWILPFESGDEIAVGRVIGNFEFQQKEKKR